MACRWRIRHKLILGLGLVISIMALMLTGTLKGLLSYIVTVKTVDSKLIELDKAGKFKLAVSTVDTATKKEVVEIEEVRAKIAAAQQDLLEYAAQLQDTVNRGRDANNGYDENQLVEALWGYFGKLETALLDAVPAPGTVVASAFGSTRPLGRTKEQQKAITDVLEKLVQTSDDLQEAIYGDLHKRITASKSQYRSSLWIVSTTCVGGVLLLVGLLRFFYRWVFDPIRDLQQGVGRVALGDFDHRIEVHSGDEMEELAAAFNDMTERLSEMYRSLEHQVNERSRQLVRSERLAGVGFLAAGVAHEINNPLASIAFCSEALEARLAALSGRRTADEAVIVKYLKMIQQEAFRCKGIIQRLLEFSRGGEKHREPADLGELVQSVLDMVQHLPNAKGKTIAFEPHHVVAWVNAQEVKSVVLNLVVNALDSMEEGGTLTIRLSQRAGRAELVFADTGCGMTAEVLENIFEPFFTRSRTGKGTGLGLTISHRIITQHGGEIEAASPGISRGSTFTVRLPLQLAEMAREEGLARAA